MDESVSTTLNQLNQQFYQTVATEFSKARQQAWAGWDQMLPLLKTQFAGRQQISVVDVGCGNGRFGQFLHHQFSEIDMKYTGLDRSPELLAVAAQTLSPLFAADTLQFIELDILATLPDLPADLICLFGVLHHIPSFAKRRELLHALASQLLPGGFMIFTAWQFDQLPQLIKRHVPASTIGLADTDLEPNDYLLTWERGTPAIRYCHLLNAPEIDQLIADSGLTLKKTFLADGQTRNVNQYVMLEKLDI